MLYGYDDVARVANLAAHAGQHLILTGPPGTGKSTFAREFFARFEGGVFATQLSRWSDETAIFGVPNLRHLREKGEIRYNVTGLLAARWSFIDEVFDASDVLLRTLLGILEERVFSRGSFSTQVPLETCIATGNYTRLTEMTAAVLDRFTLAVQTPVLSPEQRTKLWTDPPNGATRLHLTKSECEPQARTSLDELRDLRRRAAQLTLTPVAAAFCRKWAEKLNFSPRREARCAWLMRVAAVLRGEEETARGKGYSPKARTQDALAVLPHAVPVGTTAPVEEMRKDCDVLKNEDKQLKEIAAISPPAPDSLEHMKSIVLQIKQLRNLNPVSDAVRAERDSKLNHLQSLHAGGLKALGVMP